MVSSSWASVDGEGCTCSKRTSYAKEYVMHLPSFGDSLVSSNFCKVVPPRSEGPGRMAAVG
jgi:hypothetical protein